MDLDDLHPADDYSHRFFIWHEWIQANGPLTTENVFDYFASSMFYDKQSNNQVLRMQTMHTGQPILNEAEELRRFTGIEFALVHAQPPALFVIHKRERLSPDEVRPLAAYFIMNNRIYQSPDLYTVLSNRLLTSLHSLQSSLDILRTHRPDFTPRTGFVWPIVEAPTSDNASKKRATDDEPNDVELGALANADKRNGPSISAAKKQQNLLPLMNAMLTTAAHSTTSFAQRSSESAPPDLPQDTLRSSTTPGPVREESPIKLAARVPAPQETAPSTRPPLAASGGSKKKKKRMSSAAAPSR